MLEAGAFLFVCAGSLGLALLLPRSAAAASDPGKGIPICVATGKLLPRDPPPCFAGTHSPWSALQ